MQDHGAAMLSVPVYFLNDSVFKRSFPTNTFIVHYVMLSDLDLCQHYVAIFGTDTIHIQLNEPQLQFCMSQWAEHGARMVPSYRTGSADDAHAVIDLTGGGEKRPAKKKRKRDCLTSPRRTRSLYVIHPTLKLDWSVDRIELVDANGVSGRTASPPTIVTTQFPDTLVRVVDNLLVAREPWAWTSNSCHLDSWLMVELALYDTLARRQSFSDALVLRTPRLQRLFKVLLGVGLDGQEALRDAYWAMEIEEWRGPSARSTFGRTYDYDIHRQILYSDGHEGALESLTKMTVSISLSCSSPEHDNVVVKKDVYDIQSCDAWYSMPQDSARTSTGRDKKEEWRMQTVRAHQHTGPADQVATLIARSDSMLTACKCGKGFVAASKIVNGARMPVSLAFQVFGSKTPIPLAFTLGGLEYRLVGVVFGNTKHFICNVLLKGSWYHYDDLGLRDPVLFDGNGDGVRRPGSRLVRIKGDAYLTPGQVTYTPVTARYIRTVTDTLIPLRIPQPNTVPQEQQFKEFSMLWEQADVPEPRPQAGPAETPGNKPLVHIVPRPQVRPVQRVRKKPVTGKRS